MFLLLLQRFAGGAAVAAAGSPERREIGVSHKVSGRTAATLNSGGKAIFRSTRAASII